MSALDNDGSSAISRDIAGGDRPPLSASSAHAVYEIAHTAEQIISGKYTQVALQFPDELLIDSTIVSQELQKLIPPTTRVFILADTSFGSCCVDEVAAEHYSADLVVHYGKTCLSLTSRVPVLYVFGREQMDVPGCRQSACCGNACEQPAATSADGSSDVSLETTGITPGRSWDLAAGKSLSDYTILYLGSEGATLTNLMLTARAQCVFSYNAQTHCLREESATANRHLSRRYFAVQRAKDADVIGIVVGTVAATRYIAVLQQLKQMVKRAHKKLYVFVVGKMSMVKLANFAEIEAFVLVACPENSLVDGKDFDKPIVTPFEMMLAMSRTREWTGDYVTDFGDFLELAQEDEPQEDCAGSGSEDSDTPHYSLVTGALKHRRRYNDPAASGGVEAGAGDLILRNNKTDIAKYLGSAAAEHLMARSFRGLGHDEDADEREELPPMLAIEGRSGIARGYNTAESQDHRI
ncbi:putative diphthamide synthesis protein-domain-containing protein [Kickxella alabastrina]|uniref:putative diphthamide synthesis protein-domain-containing protein n=1 Tax=Kickxella alabastrina TaxID=61397 RepID=UPI0022202E30|nr:putative diphthamide synthesis protein-domain-containing protein [Kickxella alabastrina]KAI7831075.1 putative diphthamide synthesis protein-domain-containing protein [Kickxella alabastrina]